MPSPSDRSDTPAGPPASTDRYTVVARRYRPQTFQELVGQSQVSQALSNAIATHRVGHAYLFTGARGVGKTSTARIFAKALNCVQGPISEPCNVCDICLSIASGGDVDVLEIDGASNRGIDEIRQLRSTIGVRPSRSRFKVFIIDEVHMLTKEAFNALLKTLEEPPAHVKFLFCTTDPEKIPITVLSRCQRFDFPPVETQAILERLQQIAQAEGVAADEEALRLLARRASGSMRDSQSLLEQLLSFSSQRISVADVNAMLGAAGSQQLGQLLEHLQAQQAAAALIAADQAIGAGVDPAQLAEQLAGVYRDMMAAAVGCPADMMLYSSPEDYPALAQAGQEFGSAAIMGAMQILDETLVRMRQSPLARTLLEVALVRICSVSQLQDIADVIADLRDGAAPPGAQKKTAGRLAATSQRSAADIARPRAGPLSAQPQTGPEAATGVPTMPDTPSRLDGAPHEIPPGSARKRLMEASSALAASQTLEIVAPSAVSAPQADRAPAVEALAEPLAASDLPYEPTQPAGDSQQGDPLDAPGLAGLVDADNAETIWREALKTLDQESLVAESAGEYFSVAISGPNRLAVQFLESYNWHMQRCERPESKARILEALRRVTGCSIQLDFALCPDGKKNAQAAAGRRPSRRQLARDAEKHPLVAQAVELFGAEVVRATQRERTKG